MYIVQCLRNSNDSRAIASVLDRPQHRACAHRNEAERQPTTNTHIEMQPTHIHKECKMNNV